MNYKIELKKVVDFHIATTECAPIGWMFDISAEHQLRPKLRIANQNNCGIMFRNFLWTVNGVKCPSCWKIHIWRLAKEHKLDIQKRCFQLRWDMSRIERSDLFSFKLLGSSICSTNEIWHLNCWFKCHESQVIEIDSIMLFA